MKRKFLAKAITLGLMLAVPLGVEAKEFGNIVVKQGETENITEDSIKITTTENSPTVWGKPTVIGFLGDQKSTSVVKATNGDIYVTHNDSRGRYMGNSYGIYISGKKADFTASNEFKIDGFVRALDIDDGHVTITANKIDFVAASHAINVYKNGTLEINCPTVFLKAENQDGIGVNVSGGSTLTFNKAEDIVINGNVVVRASEGRTSRANINASKNITINGCINNIGDKGGNLEGGIVNINTDGKAESVNVTGDIYTGEMEINGSQATSSGGSININISGEKSYLTGNIYDKDTANGAENGVHLEVKNGATWATTGDSIVKEVKSDGGVIAITGNRQNVEIKNLKGTDTTIKTDSTDNKLTVSINSSNITVEKNGLNSDNIGSDVNGTMKKVLDVVKVGENKGNVTAVAKAGVVGGDITATKNGDNVIVHEAVNIDNEAISNMASISLMTWRQENNDMNKRLGELRDSKGEHGAWARMARGESKYGAQNIKNQYNYYQVGYDEKLSTNPNWSVGVAMTRTEGSGNFTNGSAENTHTGVAVYGSYLKDDGSFIDLIAKYARMKNEFTINGGAGNGDYETNGYSISTEYGKRFTKDNGFWIEPQVELTYGYVGAASFLSSNGANVRQDGMDSLVGRIGFSLGRDIKAGNVYARASYLYDFDGETDVTFSKGNVTRGFKQDLGGGWWEVGVGTNINLSDATHLYFDVEKTYGGNVATPWQWNAGVRWSF